MDSLSIPEGTMAKRGKRGVRYTAEKRATILAAAKKEGLTGAQVAKRFGIASLTFYKWRGPVRSDAVARRGKRGPDRPKGSRVASKNAAAISNALREQVRKLLPQIIREEVTRALSGR
jgi:transposase-like protein